MSDRIQIFLAHASEDQEKVIEIYDSLLKRGYAPWLDKKNLIAGQNWKKEIFKAINNSDIFIACFSSKSINKTGFIQRELKLALDKLVEIPESKIFLIPLRLDNCSIPELQRPDLGINLRDIHWLDFWEQDGFEKLIKAIKSSQHRIKLQSFDFEVVIVDASGFEVKRDKSFAEYFTENLGNGVTLDMVAIPRGQFLMGSPEGEGRSNEKPQHPVNVPSFFMGKYQVTQKQWRAIANLPLVDRDLKANPSKFKGDNRPVECVSWYSAVEFCARLSRKTGREYRLPSEAEWEYASRAGTTTPFHFGETITREVVNCKRNLAMALIGIFAGETTEVGSFKVANAFGLYDMHGNVWEWCADAWHVNYSGAPNDGRAWRKSGNDNRSPLRGGSWSYDPYVCRSAFRGLNLSAGRADGNSNIGFRVVCVGGRTN